MPLFAKADLPLSTVLIAYLDKERPLSEPRWVKTGDVQDWLKSMFGRVFWTAGDAADGWEEKIEVVDPDPVSPGSLHVRRYPSLINDHDRLPLFSRFSGNGRQTPMLALKTSASDS